MSITFTTWGRIVLVVVAGTALAVCLLAAHVAMPDWRAITIIAGLSFFVMFPLATLVSLALFVLYGAGLLKVRCPQCGKVGEFVRKKGYWRSQEFRCPECGHVPAGVIFRFPHWKVAGAAASILLSAYLAAPIAAGAFEIGNRWGPKIYPITMHEELYKLGWSLTTHKEQGKPRMPYYARPELRPLFYGMSSPLDNPPKAEAE